MIKIHKTYQHRAYTSRAGYETLAEVMRESARLYNAALEEWRWAYRAGVSVSLYSQYRELTAIRADDAFWGGISLQVARGVRNSCRFSMSWMTFVVTGIRNSDVERSGTIVP